MANQNQKRVLACTQRISCASLRNKTKRVKWFQNKVKYRLDAKRLAVCRVTAENKGKRTPGINKHDANTDQEKMASVRKLRLRPE